MSIMTVFSFSQVSFTILEPASIAGGYEFTSNGDAVGWGLADLNNPIDAVTDTVVIADDGTPGINAQGIPFANEACAPLINDVAGKIVMIYRYDGASTNSCWGSTRVLNAQNAGAVGVIFVNREDDTYGYPSAPDGSSVTIPFAFITKSDGEIIRAKVDAGDDVVAFIGNKSELYQNDVGIVKRTTLAPLRSSIPSQTSLDASEFGFDVGAIIYNYGSNDQNNVVLTATVTGAGGTWTETAGPFSINSGDSLDVVTGGVNNIDAFSFGSYPDGNYHLSYNVDIGVLDSSDFDNNINYHFTVSDSMYSFCYMDTVTNNAVRNTFNRAGEPQFTACIAYSDANASRLAGHGVYAQATMAWNSTAALEGNLVTSYLFQWDDNFVDINDVDLGFSALTVLAEGEYIFDAGDDSQIVYIPFEEPVLLEDNQRYLACLEVWNEDVWIGYNRRINYNRHVEHYLQPITPIQAAFNWFVLGFTGGDNTPAMAFKVFDESELSIKETSNLNFFIYPNPTNSMLSISVPDWQSGELIITDLSGRQVDIMQLFGSFNQIDVSHLDAGQYVITILDQDGAQSSEKFMKL